MKKLISIKERISEKDLKISVHDPSKLLAEFFDGVVIKVAEEYVYES